MSFPFSENFRHNIAETRTYEDGSIGLSRVPYAMWPELNQKAQERAECLAGAELRFRLLSPKLSLVFRRMSDRNAAYFAPAAILVGVFHGDYQAGWYALGEGDTTITIEPSSLAPQLAEARTRFDSRLIRIVMPVFPAVRLISVQGDVAPPEPGDVPALNYLAYGSSITHGAYTPLGTGTYPAVIARELGVDVANMGFGGGAHLEPSMADWLAARTDWHFASLEMGVNILGIEPAEFRARVRRFLAPFAADSRSRPVLCLDVLRKNGEFALRNPKTELFRQIVAEETAALKSDRFAHVPFSDALGHVTGLADDLVHPSTSAFEDIGRCMAARFRAIPAIASLLGQAST